MKICVLTPNSVGSTILQRILTLALFLQGQDIQNCDELTNGIAICDHRIYKEPKLKFSQDLEQICSLLLHSKTSLISCVAKNMMDQRQDAHVAKQNFYQFLNQYNDSIIMCTRKNIFEYALSWAIREQTNVLNIYTPKDREHWPLDQTNKVNVKFFLSKCEEYVRYVYWVNDNFPNATRIDYEDFVNDPGRIVNNICKIENTMQEFFGASLDEIFKHEYNINKKQMDMIDHNNTLPTLKYKNIMMMLGSRQILPLQTEAPIKNTSLTDKKQLVGNFDKCKTIFKKFAKKHNWIDTSTIDYDFWQNTTVL